MALNLFFVFVFVFLFDIQIGQVMFDQFTTDPYSFEEVTSSPITPVTPSQDVLRLGRLLPSSIYLGCASWNFPWMERHRLGRNKRRRGFNKAWFICLLQTSDSARCWN